MSKELRILDKSEVHLLKGLAILLIVTHNFFHWVEPRFGENEFSFSRNKINSFIDLVFSSKIDLLHATLSFVGHYGVQVFIFCSAYGLTIKYRNNIFSNAHFFKQRVLKLYPTFTIALLLLIIYNYYILESVFDFKMVKLIVLRYSLLANLFPGKAFIVSGPFWFYSMIFQFYFVFPFLLNLIKQRRILAQIIIPIFIIINILFNDLFDSYDFSLYFNLVGNLPVLIFGMIATGYNIRALNSWAIILPSIVVFAAGQYYGILWYFTQLSFLCFFIPLSLKLFKIIRLEKIKNTVLHIGKLSMYLFAVHGFLRIPWVTNSNASSDNMYGNFALYLLIIYVVAYCTKSLENRIISILKK